VHRLGPSDRTLLLAASLLHDVGRYLSNRQHHKHSLYLLAHSELPGLTERQMHVVGNIARYHRKSEPRLEHSAFVGLSEADQERVRRLASILRLADALDRDHQQRIKRVSVTAEPGELLLGLESAHELDLELDQWALARKAVFFSHVYRLKVRVLPLGSRG
jgi:exopolyphosphatase/guanosine-5'-triphosphate,3'-diphosphate pyrophosphatase